jgi:hypothetical protein
MTKKRLVKLIMNCKKAYRTCTSDWGKQYWSDVEKQLRIKYKNILN